jgi:hypothetical protein
MRVELSESELAEITDALLFKARGLERLANDTSPATGGRDTAPDWSTQARHLRALAARLVERSAREGQ